MSYTTMGQPQGVSVYYTNKIRESMVSEIVAINKYVKHILTSGNFKDIQEVLETILEDEIRHYNMYFDLLRKYDSAQMKAYEAVKQDYTMDRLLNRRQYNFDNTEVVLELNKLRLDSKGELEAVILYEYNMNAVKPLDIKHAYLTIINDEKRHLEDLTYLINKYGVV
ncbi:rubrerythrin [Vallitalea okinawensis]|uniref:rubrerythrin n=1 Tax=Vallitalea okinawensis TaxID=2078660 RepID=UPI000CFBB794|nr:rubrerythrin [Vallitalea okinawensis]